MEPVVRTPQELFSLPQLLEVPLYQRPYVWEEEHQWQPLWEDVVRLAEVRRSEPSKRHFMGAVVTQVRPAAMGAVTTFELIDGQQRLTTLQLLMDAAALIFEERGFVNPAQRLAALTRNAAFYDQSGAGELKIRHLNDDGPEFRAAMDASATSEFDEMDTRIARAHRFFQSKVEEWLDGAEGDPAARAQELAVTIDSGLQLVVITLGEREDAQIIFETLNARGTPLNQGDLIKNFVFKGLVDEGVDVATVRSEVWRPLEERWWRAEASLGRHSLDRLSLFLNHWLVARTGREISTPRTFDEFRRWCDTAGVSMAEIVVDLAESAALYRDWLERAKSQDDLDTSALFTYRTQAVGVEAVRPMQLFLYTGVSEVPRETADAALRHVESWTMRRALLRRGFSDAGRVISTLIGELLLVAPEMVAERTQSYLAAQTRPGTYWPSDEEVRTYVREAPAYREHSRARLRAFLETYEDAQRGFTRGGRAQTGVRVPRNRLQVEHLMPQKWRAHWPVPNLEAELEREKYVHRFGNLTLLTGSLNSQVSNAGWERKRKEFGQYEVLVTRKVQQVETWDEHAIDARADEIADALIHTWPTPSGHHVVMSAARATLETDWIDFRELVAVGLVPADTPLKGQNGTEATVLPSGRIRVGAREFDSPSGAAAVAANRKTANGWTFWRVPDGRRLSELKPEFRTMRQEAETKGSAGASTNVD
ncbi:DUF262 domain-containing protein [Dermacoccus sp. GAS27A]|uniref:GmrSD restriction endonuclease domain-containing protein n=1 Tax=Dermacoccus sp. GAS27A TaxID=3156270 RepID=UPI003833473E